VVVLLTWLSWRFFTQSWLSGEASNNVGGLPLWPAKMLLPVGFGLLLLQGLAEMVKRCGLLLSVQDLDLHYEKPLQ
jgi:TRAP-type mannitol/chloroaromatic compound transport system permease small subunit